MSLQFSANVLRGEAFTLNAELSLDTDRVTALYGPSGSGKTSILRLIAGLDHEPGVNVQFNDTIWQSDSVFVPAHERQIGYVFQHLNLFPHLDVTGNLNFAEHRKHRQGGLGRDEVIDMLDLGLLMRKSPSQLSGGEQQRVAIARALLSNPCLLLMDEPLGSIDAEARSRILPYLQRLHTHLSTPVVYVSHSLDEILYFSDKVVSVEQGQIRDISSTMAFSVSGRGIQQPDAAAIISCTVTGSDNGVDLLQLSFEEQTLYIADEGYTPGNRIQVRIPARDVSIARQQPIGSSIINIIESTVLDIHDTGQGPSAVVTLACGNQQLLARITRKSVKDMQLKKGEPVFAQIKGVALMSDYER
jgi:molybdate transport system ATP-binding protein